MSDATSLPEPAPSAPGGRPIPTLSAAARAHGLSPRAFAVLACAAATPGASASGIGRRLGLDKSAVSYAVANLKRLGLAAVQVDPADQRRSRISATAAGIARLRTVTAAVRQAPAVEAPPPGPVTHAALVAA